MAISAILPNANEVSNWPLIPTAAYVAGTDRTTPFNVDRFSSAEIVCVCSAITGGTLDIYIQELLPGQTTYGDIAHLAQITGASTVRLSFVSGGNSIQAVTEGALAANTVLTVNIGASWSLKYVLVTGPATFGVFGNFKA